MRRGNREKREGEKRSLPIVVCAYTIGYLGYYLSNILFLVLSLPFVLLFAPFPTVRRRVFLRVIHWYAYFLTRVYLPLLGVCHIDEISGLDECRLDVPLVYVSNHRGRLDALLLIGLLGNTIVVIKSKHAKFPMLAHLVQYCGFVSIDRGSAASIASAQEKCRATAASGTNLLLFPEGTRTTGVRLQRFGGMAFKIAVDGALPVVPVVLYSRNAFMAGDISSYYPRARIGYRIRFLAPVYPGENDTPADLSDRVYRAMTAELKTLDISEDAIRQAPTKDGNADRN